MAKKSVRYSIPDDRGRAHTYCGTFPMYGNKRPKGGPYLARVYALLRKDAPKWEGFSFMPKGEVQ